MMMISDAIQRRLCGVGGMWTNRTFVIRDADIDANPGQPKPITVDNINHGAKSLFNLTKPCMIFSPVTTV